MNSYEQQALAELHQWQKEMQARPGIFSSLAKNIQTRFNRIIPQKVHNVITRIIKEMIRGVLYASKKTDSRPATFSNLETTEKEVRSLISFFKTTASVEGGATGAGGFLWSLADFPALIALKIKMLFDIAGKYGYNTDEYSERLFILYIFQAAFSSPQNRAMAYERLTNWSSQKLPENIHELDWQHLQQEYRDHIDLAKMAQMIPVVGAVAGTIANYQLVKKLGNTAMQAYRMRLLDDGKIS